MLTVCEVARGVHWSDIVFHIKILITDKLIINKKQNKWCVS